MKSILDPTFKYVPSHQTDVRKTFDSLFPGWNKKPVVVDSITTLGQLLKLKLHHATPRKS